MRMKATALWNIQRFAGNLNTNTTGTSTLSAEMKTYYDKELLDEAEPELVHDQFGQERNIPKNGGKTIEFRKFSSLPKATTPLTEGVTPDGKTLTVTASTATVNQYGDYVAISDQLELTAIDNTLVETVALLGSQAGRTLDTVTREILNAGTNVMYAPKLAANGTETAVASRAAITTECKFTPTVVARAAAILKAANAKKIDGSYVCIIHPYLAEELMAEAGKAWIDIVKYKDTEKIYNGEIGKLFGVRFVESTEAKIWKGTTDNAADGVAVFSALFIAANAYGKTSINGGGLETIIKQLGSAGTADPLNQRSTAGWKATKTAKILTQEYMLRVECGSRWNDQVEAN